MSESIYIFRECYSKLGSRFGVLHGYILTLIAIQMNTAIYVGLAKRKLCMHIFKWIQHFTLAWQNVSCACIYSNEYSSLCWPGKM